jgi:hypothetical protein
MIWIVIGSLILLSLAFVLANSIAQIEGWIVVLKGLFLVIGLPFLLIGAILLITYGIESL